MAAHKELTLWEENTSNNLSLCSKLWQMLSTCGPTCDITKTLMQEKEGRFGTRRQPWVASRSLSSKELCLPCHVWDYRTSGSFPQLGCKTIRGNPDMGQSISERSKIWVATDKETLTTRTHSGCKGTSQGEGEGAVTCSPETTLRLTGSSSLCWGDQRRQLHEQYFKPLHWSWTKEGSTTHTRMTPLPLYLIDILRLCYSVTRYVATWPKTPGCFRFIWCVWGFLVWFHHCLFCLIFSNWASQLEISGRFQHVCGQQEGTAAHQKEIKSQLKL